jgi:site-specific recombinase XerC
MLKNCQLTSSDLTTRVAIASFRIIRARFNKRSTQLFLGQIIVRIAERAARRRLREIGDLAELALDAL